MHMHHDDTTVIRSVLQGRQADYALLVERYQQYVFSLVLRYVPNREVAEELSQDVFVKAYTHLASFKGESKFSTWLYTIVHTTCLSYLRKKNNGPVLLEEEKMASLGTTIEHENAENTLQLKHRNELLNKAIGKLPAQEGQTLALFYQGEQSVEEISKITDTTVSNVKVRLFRARQKLKEIISTHYKEELSR
jgi:RNA polymerase sigma factor (sigma-70 family)